MPKLEIDHSILFVPGRASYLEPLDDTYSFHLTPGSERRATVAAQTFDPDFHSKVIFAGGYPGIAQQWPQEHIEFMQQSGNSEAESMSALFFKLLDEEQHTPDLQERVNIQGDSNNSLGDIYHSYQKGYLSMDELHSDHSLGIELATGRMHGMRFTRALSKAFDIDPRRISLVDMQDTYGSEATAYRAAESRPKAIINELGALTVNEVVRLRHIKRGDPESLGEAERQFNQIALRLAA